MEQPLAAAAGLGPGSGRGALLVSSELVTMSPHPVSSQET